MKHLRIFLSSPGDVRPERERAEAVIRSLDAELPEIELEAVRWEMGVYRANSTFQDQIITPGECDLVVCLFWKRLGTQLPADYDRPDGSPRAGTEYEFEQAMAAASASPSDQPDVLVYRKTAGVQYDAEHAAEEQAEHQALKAFWARWFQDEEGHFLAAFHTFVDPDDFEQTFHRDLGRWLREHRHGEWDVTVLGSPFRGLQAFDEAHAQVFFGRRRLILRARARLMTGAEKGGANLMVLGASGSGKSSLVRAGLIPRLQIPRDTAPWVARWRRIVVTPAGLGDHAIKGLAQALYGEDVLPELGQGDYPDPEGLARLLANSPEDALRPIISALDRWAAVIAEHEGHAERPCTGLLLVVDQLEEIFQLAHDQRDALLQLLVAAAGADRIWVITTLRSDFYPVLQTEPELITLRARSAHLDVPPPTAADAREMVEGAVRAAGLELEEQRLENGVDRSLADELEAVAGEPGSLPMLQFALQSLFERRDPASGLLRLADYDSLGGAAGALATEADRAIAELGPDAEIALAGVIRRLVNLDAAGEREQAPQARTVALATFPADSAERRLVDALLERRLLVAQGGDGDTPAFVRVAHERLLHSWPRAAQQIAADHRDLQTRARLEQSQELWEHAAPEERERRLLTGLALEEGRDLERRWGAQLPPGLRAFIDRSLRAERARRRWRRMTVSAVMATLAGLAVVSVIFFLRADRELRKAQVTQSRLLAHISEQALDQGFRLAALHLALESFRLGGEGSADGPNVPASERALLSAALEQRELGTFGVSRGEASPGCGPAATATGGPDTAAQAASSHGNAVTDVAYGPRGRRAASAAENGGARLWDPRDCRPVARLAAHGGGITDIEFGPTGQRLATASLDHTVRLWSADDGSPRGEPLQHGDNVLFVEFDPAGETILTGTAGAVARLWDARTGEPIARFDGHDDDIVVGTFSAAGDRVATGDTGSGEAPSVFAWGLDGERVSAFSGHRGRILELDFRREETAVASVSRQGAAMVWDSESGERITDMDTGLAPIDVAQSADGGGLMAISGPTGRIHVLDAGAGRIVAELAGHEEAATALDFAPGAQRLASAGRDQDIRVWDLRKGGQRMLLRGHGGRIRSIAYGPQGERLISAGHDRSVRIWDVGAGPGQAELSSPGGRMAVDAVFDADGDRVFGVFPDRIEAWEGGDYTRALRLDLRGQLGRAADTEGFDLAPDSRHAVALSVQGAGYIWDLRDGRLVAELEQAGDRLKAAFFSADGQSIRAVTRTGDLVVFSAEDGAVEQRSDRSAADGITSVVTAVDRCRDDRNQLVLAYRDAVLERLRIGRDVGRETIEIAGDQPVSAVAFAPGCRRLAAGDVSGAVRMPAGDATGTPTVIDAHGDRITALRYHPSGNRLASAAGARGRVKLWDPASGEHVGTVDGHDGHIRSISFSPDGQRMATASRDGTVRIAPAFADRAGLLEYARRLVVRPLNEREMRLFPAGREENIQLD